MSPNGIIRIFICLATLASATLVSCRRTGHEEPVPGTGTERPDDVRVSFRIALGSTNGTRAGGTPEGSYDDGTQSEFENGIDLENGNYRFFFFDAQNRYLSAFQTVELIPEGEDPDRSKTYEVVGKTDKMPPANFKVVALANWPSYPGKMTAGETTIEELCTAESSRYVLRTVRTVPRTADSDVRRKKLRGDDFHTGDAHPSGDRPPAARHGQGGGELQDIGLDARKGRTAPVQCDGMLRSERGLLAGRLCQGKLRRRLHGRRASAGRQERRGPENTRIRPHGGRAFRRLRPRIPERRGRDREPQSGRRSRNAGPIQGGARQGVYRRIQILQRAARRQRRRRSVRHPAQLLLQILDFEDIRTGSRRRGVSPTSRSNSIPDSDCYPKQTTETDEKQSDILPAAGRHAVRIRFLYARRLGRGGETDRQGRKPRIVRRDLSGPFEPLPRKNPQPQRRPDRRNRRYLHRMVQ